VLNAIMQLLLSIVLLLQFQSDVTAQGKLSPLDRHGPHLDSLTKRVRE